MPNPLDLDPLKARNAARRALKEAATAGPWEAGHIDAEDEESPPCRVRAGSGPGHWYDPRAVHHIGALDLATADSLFIAAARSDDVEADVDALCAEVERLRMENAELRARPCGHAAARQWAQSAYEQDAS